jgi:hypothetical protein
LSEFASNELALYAVSFMALQIAQTLASFCTGHWMANNPSEAGKSRVTESPFPVRMARGSSPVVLMGIETRHAKLIAASAQKNGRTRGAGLRKH